MKLRKFAAAALLLATLGSSAAEPPKREFRSIWMAAMGIDWPRGSSAVGTSESAQANAKAALIEYIENFKRHNFNGICLQVRPLADALYRSSLEPWSASVSGTRGVDPGWDPLAFAVEECHKRGLEIYAWINPFRINNTGGVYDTDFDKEWREKGWELKSGNWTIFNPALPEARQHCYDVIREIYTNYAIDGVIFDDYFYPGDHLTEASSAGDYKLWQEAKSGLSIADWRRRNVNEVVAEIYEMIQRDRPDMHYGIGPAGTAGKSSALHGVKAPTAGYDWQYDDIYADPLAWLHEGTIDFISPQIYWPRNSSSSPFTPIAEWWQYVADHFGRHNYISMASYRVSEELFGGNNADGGWSEFVAQVQIGRELAPNTSGQVYFSAAHFDGPSAWGLGDWLEEKVYQNPALIPPLDWKEHVTYSAPAGARLEGCTLSWDAMAKPRENTIMRYTVYAIPLSTSYEEVMGEDGIDGKYLLDVTYEPSYTLTKEQSEHHWYAVCVYDGYGFEHTPATINYTGERSQATTLIAPADKATVDWDADLSWTPVAGARYIVEVSDTPDFKSVRYSFEDLTEPNVTVDLSDARDGQTLYWRVAVCETDKLYNYTEPSSFIAPVRTEGEKPVVVTPDAGAHIDGSEVTVSWNHVKYAERYYVEIARPGNFENPVYGAYVSAPETSLKVNTAVIGSGEFECRIFAHGRRFLSVESDKVGFEVGEPPVGTTEQGYAVTTDAGYSERLAGIDVESTWYRSTSSGASAIAFEGDGSQHRSMAANRDFVYITERSADKADADISLRQYNAATGEHVRDITLTGATEQVSILPCNQVVFDSRGHLCVINQTGSVAMRPLTVSLVNMATGELTEVAQAKGSGPTHRTVDYAAIYGDVTSGEFYIFAVISSRNVLLRWKVVDGEATLTDSNVTKEFSGSTANFGTGPRLLPVDETRCYVDHANGTASLYDFTTGKLVTSLAATPASAVNTDNGMALFNLNGYDYVAYNTGAAATGSTMAIAALGQNSAHNYSSMAHLCTLPRTPMGIMDNAVNSVPVEAVAIDNNTVRLYMYSPGNGLACYTVRDNTGGVADIAADADTDIRVSGLQVILSRAAASVKAYTVTGMLVASASNADTLTLPAAGTYLVTADGTSRMLIAR